LEAGKKKMTMSRIAAYHSTRVTATQYSLTVRHLKQLMDFVAQHGLSPDQRVEVHLEQSYNHPTDPGGRLSLEIEIAVDSEGKVIR